MRPRNVEINIRPKGNIGDSLPGHRGLVDVIISQCFSLQYGQM
jgi:hypothetical protein